MACWRCPPAWSPVKVRCAWAAASRPVVLLEAAGGWQRGGPGLGPRLLCHSSSVFFAIGNGSCLGEGGGGPYCQPTPCRPMLFNFALQELGGKCLFAGSGPKGVKLLHSYQDLSRVSPSSRASGTCSCCCYVLKKMNFFSRMGENTRSFDANMTT